MLSSVCTVLLSSSTSMHERSCLLRDRNHSRSSLPYWGEALLLLLPLLVELAALEVVLRLLLLAAAAAVLLAALALLAAAVSAALDAA